MARLSLPLFRVLHRVKTKHITNKDVHEGNGNRRRSFESAWKANWIQWHEAFGVLVLTPTGDAAYADGVAKGWVQRLNPHVESQRRIDRLRGT